MDALFWALAGGFALGAFVTWWACRPRGLDFEQERAIDAWRWIRDLTAEEGDAIEIPCENPDWSGPDAIVICCGGWTNWEPRTFEGRTQYHAVEAAAAEFERLSQPALGTVWDEAHAKIHPRGTWERFPNRYIPTVGEVAMRLKLENETAN